MLLFLGIIFYFHADEFASESQQKIKQHNKPNISYYRNLFAYRTQPNKFHGTARKYSENCHPTFKYFYWKPNKIQSYNKQNVQRTLFDATNRICVTTNINLNAMAFREHSHITRTYSIEEFRLSVMPLESQFAVNVFFIFCVFEGRNNFVSAFFVQ